MHLTTSFTRQEDHLLQRGRATLHVVEKFAKSLKITGNGTIPQIAHDFILAFHGNYGPPCIISEIKQDIGQKSQFFAFLACTDSTPTDDRHHCRAISRT